MTPLATAGSMGNTDSRIPNNRTVQEKRSHGGVASQVSGVLLAHTYVETDGPDGYRVEHHKNGGGEYQCLLAEVENGRWLREKPADPGAEDRVAESYEQSKGSYGRHVRRNP